MIAGNEQPLGFNNHQRDILVKDRKNSSGLTNSIAHLINPPKRERDSEMQLQLIAHAIPTFMGISLQMNIIKASVSGRQC